MIAIGKIYSFEELEKAINEQEYGRAVFVRVKNIECGIIGLMTTFQQNFAQNWLSGNGVIFYSDGETHSANEYDEFEVIAIIPINDISQGS